MRCRFCKQELTSVFIDLGNSPASNSYLTKEELNEPEVFYPLKVFTCSQCYLVQLDEYKKSEAIFDHNYAYFSSYSKSWLAHAKDYTDMMCKRFELGSHSRVVEIASNDGYLLQYFKQRNIPVLGIEPTSNTAEVATKKGIDTITEFFGVPLARQLIAENIKADLLLGNNVLAHVPDIMDFVAGMKILLNDNGVLTMEFPHLMQLVNNNQFDTIYHEHFSYLSFHTVLKIFESHNLRIFDVEELSTHGGSLRIYAKHFNNEQYEITTNVASLLMKEKELGMCSLEYYSNFQSQAFAVKTALLDFILKQKKEGRKIAAYGAAAKGNTLLNYCGIKNDFIDFVVDANPHKQNKYMPASHIPILSEDAIRLHKPDLILILPWNLKEEVISQLSYIKEWGGKFVVPVPFLQIIPA